MILRGPQRTKRVCKGSAIPGCLLIINVLRYKDRPFLAPHQYFQWKTGHTFENVKTSFFALSLILGGKLDVCRRDELFLLFTRF